ncbi:MAG: alpha/beta hydrolase [Proteobacteria bacterium]|nr:alpha/beta hydrolase [Pseudomonadota bacterium]
MSAATLIHARSELALHALRGGEGRPLLCLHALGECTPTTLPEALSGWPGPVYGLDFTGHGQSTLPRGGGYTAELLMGDADAAVAELGPVTLCGRGLGAYVALLLAGARPEQVRGAILCDGTGLAGGGPEPTTPMLVRTPAVDRSPDPQALIELARDVRPPDYATSFARQAAQLSGLEAPLTVVARERPDWLASVVEEPGVEVGSLAQALARYAALPTA